MPRWPCSSRQRASGGSETGFARSSTSSWAREDGGLSSACVAFSGAGSGRRPPSLASWSGAVGAGLTRERIPASKRERGLPPAEIVGAADRVSRGFDRQRNATLESVGERAVDLAELRLEVRFTELNRAERRQRRGADVEHRSGKERAIVVDRLEPEPLPESSHPVDVRADERCRREAMARRPDHAEARV